MVNFSRPFMVLGIALYLLVAAAFNSLVLNSILTGTGVLTGVWEWTYTIAYLLLIGFYGELIWRRATSAPPNIVRTVLFLTIFPILGYVGFFLLWILSGFGGQFIG